MIAKEIGKHRNAVFLCFLGIVYFFLVLWFYISQYHAFDDIYYYSMAAAGEKAKDGFSSLFLSFAAFGAHMGIQLQILCLLLITGALINISFFISSLFLEPGPYYYISLVFLYSCGIFYYVYGKHLYDFPFTAFNYSLCLLGLCKLNNGLKQSENMDPKGMWLLFCGGLGLCLSWKPYNIFCVAGLGLLLFARETSRKYLFQKVLRSPKRLLLSLLCFAAGYVAGNYNLLISPKETIKGLAAYPASCDFISFLASKFSWISWDHVNHLPFRFSVMSLCVTAILMYILPILIRKPYYLAISVFMTGCLYIYIEKFSPGYSWHGFPFGLFLITYAAVILSDASKAPPKGRKIRLGILLMAAILQVTVNFAYYLPLQVKWQKNTNRAIDVLEREEPEIYAATNHLIDEIGDCSYTIDIAVKRFVSFPFGPDTWRKISLQYPYHAATNYIMVNPLEATNWDDWTRLQQDEQCVGEADAEYVIHIVPNPFKQMRQIAQLDRYDGYDLTDSVHGEGYSVYLYRKP